MFRSGAGPVRGRIARAGALRVALAVGLVAAIAACGGGGSDTATPTSAASTKVGTAAEFCARIDAFKKVAQVLPTIDMSDTAPVEPTRAKMLEVVVALQKVFENPPPAILIPSAEGTELIERIRRAIAAATTTKQLREQVPVVITTLTSDQGSLARLAPIQNYAQAHCKP